LDWRRRLIDIDGVRNAWLEKVATYDPAIYVNWAESRLQYAQLPGQNKPEVRFNPRGLYRIWLDLDPTYRKDPCGQLSRSRSPVLEEVNRVLCSYRNLCEDIHEIVVLEDEEIALCTDIELAPDADPEDVLVEVYVRVQAFLLPRIQFYNLQALLEKGKSITEIFAGRPSALPDHETRFDRWPTTPDGTQHLPYSHGFIDVDELQALTPPKVLHTSDLYQVILQVPGVSAVRKLSISNFINGLRQSRGESWVLSLTPGYRPMLGIDDSQITLYKGDLPLPFDQAEVKRRYFEQQAAAIKTPRDAYELDLSVPQGTYYATLADHYSIQHDFPLTYGISEDGLPDTVPTLRKAQARQLKGYLVFFDQLLANYLAQLAHVRDLFSWEIDQGTKGHEGSDIRFQDRQHTYFTQALDFPAWPDILTDSHYLKAIAEDDVTYRERRNRFLDHLLARFAESFSDYAVLNYQLQQNGQDKAEIETNLIEDKAHFLQDYPALGRDRNRAFNYTQSPTQHPDNISGFQQRVARLLGIENVQWRTLSPDPLPCETNFIWALSLNASNSQPPLLSYQAYSTEDEARTAFSAFRQIAQEAASYKRLTYPSGQEATYGYIILDAEGCPLTLSPNHYTTVRERDEAMVNLQTWLQSDPSVSFPSRGGYLGQLKDKTGQILLQSIQPYSTEEQAWQKIYDLMKWVEDGQNLQVIDSDEGFYGWKLPRKSQAVAMSSPFYATAAERDHALDALQQKIRALSADLEGFHVLEHILLRPRQAPAAPVCSFEPVDNLPPTLLTKDYSIAIDADPATSPKDGPSLTDYCLSKKSISGHPGFECFDEGNYYFHFNDCQGQVLFYSRQHSDEAQRNLALQSVIRCSVVETCYSLKKVLWETKTFYFFTLSSTDGQELGRSRYFDTLWELEAGLQWFQYNVHKAAKDFGIDNLTVPPEYIEPEPVSDHFLPIAVTPADASTLIGEPKHQHLIWQDPYSFWITVVLPYWPTRFQNMNFRRFVERTLRLEAPAHIALRIAWVGPGQMRAFEGAYSAWLEQLALASQGAACDLTGKLNQLLKILSQLQSVYPEATLYDPQASNSDKASIVLNQTALGTTEE
jgi:hypothetical protein